ncbi:hypothetical protein D9611_012833 [Ephemerocybe angulata]|uniref:Uncharacterized protein n=1 Tax=Ephemerocybe angulata TaxID=980116 RepID=A0A8H5BAM9_9AGAR|nr:hypothetical protein D9611_012833 [Tulosesus angulatus]
MDPTGCVAEKCDFKHENPTSVTKHRRTCPEYLAYQADGAERAQRLGEQRRGKKEAVREARRAKTAARSNRPSRGKSAATQPLPTASGSRQHHSLPGSSEHGGLRQPSPHGMDFEYEMPAVPCTSSPPPSASLHRPSSPLPVSPVLPPVNIPDHTSHRRRNPQIVRDILPEALPVLGSESDTPQPLATGLVRRVRLILRDSLRTAVNSLGLWRAYPDRPTFDPDSFVPKPDLAKPAARYQEDGSSDVDKDEELPHPNASYALLSTWKDTGSNLKSNTEVERLVDEVLLDARFSLKDVAGYRAQRVADEMDKLAAAKSSLLDQFSTTSVPIEVPSGSPTVPSRTFNIPGFHFRRLTSLIKSAFSHPLAAQFHFTPYKLYHTPPSDGSTAGPTSEQPDKTTSERVYSELYDSDAFIKEHESVRKAPNPPEDPKCKREKIVAALMFWSDSTHLANFGTAKLWPIYMYLGNISKYVRAIPNSGACQHVGYIPSLPDSFQDDLAKWHTNPKQRADLLSHCRRELMHGVWKILLSDEEFQHAYKYGIVIKCLDGVERRVYPRIFTYSADYPEKVLLATIRVGGTCLCPRCLVTKAKADQMGTPADMRTRVSKVRKYMAENIRHAREWIYKFGRGVKSKVVEDYLKETSSVPTENAFYTCLGPEFDIGRMMVPDFLHEFELGVWKNLFTHLIRVLYAAAPDGKLVLELDERFRKISTFGNSTIRTFSSNTSEMKKLAARDFEDILQCCIPAFDGLLTKKDHNAQLLTLLYRTAEFHAFAKMRMHTDPTLSHLEKLTTQFGNLVRRFRDDVCSDYQTHELPGETERRARRKRKDDAQVSLDAPAGASSAVPANAPPPKSKPTRRIKELNLKTYKFHAMGDYVPFIRLFGTTDIFSTQIGELAHRLVKRLYALTNKRRIEKQIGNRVRRIEQAKVASMRRLQQQKLLNVSHRRDNGAQATEEGPSDGDRDLKYYVSASQNHPVDLATLIQSNHDDPLFENFLPKLQDHILGRCIGRDFDGDNHDDFTDEERNTVRIQGGRIYEVKTCQVNYTTYDNRRDYDVINPKTHPDIMVLSQEDNKETSPFWYARVIKVYHAKVTCTHRESRLRGAERMQFLLVRWMGDEPDYAFGFRRARLPKVGFVEHLGFAFGFLDPAQIVRGCHLIPAFDAGLTLELLPCWDTVARQHGPRNADYTNYYVNIFVDRDTVMRHYGGGIGHYNQTGKAPDEDPSGLAAEEDPPAQADPMEEDDPQPVLRRIPMLPGTGPLLEEDDNESASDTESSDDGRESDADDDDDERGSDEDIEDLYQSD